MTASQPSVLVVCCAMKTAPGNSEKGNCMFLSRVCCRTPLDSADCDLPTPCLQLDTVKAGSEIETALMVLTKRVLGLSCWTPISCLRKHFAKWQW